MPGKSDRVEAVIYHNAKCGSSRKTLALLRERGIEPEIVEYLKTPPTRSTLAELARRTGGAANILRTKEALCAELGLVQDGVGEAQILDAIATHPILLNRPVVVTAFGARVCRPPETVLEILPKSS
ncbi:MAG: arsenate reductase (glutaredoxin) [Hyphomicrobiaceae bacterium]